MQVDIDKTDRLLVQALQQDARLTSGELAQLANLSQSPTWRRVRRLEEAGLILGYHAALDRRALGYDVLAFVLVGIDRQNESSSSAFEQAVLDIPEVVMVHGISGPEDFMLVVVARDLDHYSEVLQKRLHRLPSVRQVHTHFSLQDFKGQIGNLPILPA
ncbi:Lrp/AsnC family transcriptional regulator [Hydrogenophaga atypica]|uniref:Lrp/AsnC family transcriptional regulator n=1 Tax=Hydrogenophaga atypica TaxID=249409 RepID=A0ABW2QP94_9BURK